MFWTSSGRLVYVQFMSCNQEVLLIFSDEKNIWDAWYEKGYEKNIKNEKKQKCELKRLINVIVVVILRGQKIVPCRSEIYTLSSRFFWLSKFLMKNFWFGIFEAAIIISYWDLLTIGD